MRLAGTLNIFLSLLKILTTPLELACHKIFKILIYLIKSDFLFCFHFVLCFIEVNKRRKIKFLFYYNISHQYFVYTFNPIPQIPFLSPVSWVYFCTITHFWGHSLIFFLNCLRKNGLLCPLIILNSNDYKKKEKGFKEVFLCWDICYVCFFFFFESLAISLITHF